MRREQSPHSGRIRMMKKVLVIGSGGAGKSTFARRLGAITKIEVVHLDRLYWQPNWTETPKDEWREIVEKNIGEQSWIMDGNFGGTMDLRLAACDTVVLLDLPRMVCLYRVLKRLLKYRNTNRPDMAAGCREKIDGKFLGWIWNYPRKKKPQIEGKLQRLENEKTIIRLTSKRAVEEFFANLSSDFMLN